MKCPRCQAENPEIRKFCRECGAKMVVACPQCGFENLPADKFCGDCGQKIAKPEEAPPRPYAKPLSYTPKFLADKILTSRSALEGERKQVTVLFADLKGSMELLSDRDPEEARKILDPVLERMMEAVHNYEGTVNQVMGDGIMALFGAPLAHEDHAVRACYAALRMQEGIRRYTEELRRSQGIEVQIRVGLNSGEVVVRSIGNDLHMDYTAVGQTTHLAARMEQLAAPGSIRLSAVTMNLAEGFVHANQLGPVPIKGLTNPVEVFELTGARSVRTKLQATAARGLSKFVGRDAEIEQLQRAFQQAAQGKGQVIAAVGEPGVGKSRLFYEFIHSHRTQGWLILESASVSYGKAIAYFPVIELLKGYFKVHDRDDQREIRERVTGKLMTLDPALEQTRPIFLGLFGVPVQAWQDMDPLKRQQQALESIKLLFLRECQIQPLLLVFEDLHWIDEVTQVVLDKLVESLPAARILLLVNYRPEYRHNWGSKTFYTQVRLDTLQPDKSEELLHSLLGGDKGLEGLKRQLIARTGGNPFFLEESVRGLIETGALIGGSGIYKLAKAPESFQIPATVQTVLAARIDRLPLEEKDLLQCASVIGKDFPFGLLKEIAAKSDEDLRRGLANLQAGEFVYETSLFPELEYTFKHALTNEVAYGSLLQNRRVALHRAIMEAIERLYPERLEEHVEKLGIHSLRGEVWEKAAKYLRQAGDKSALRATSVEAANHYEQALKALEGLPETRERVEEAIDIRINLRMVLFILTEFKRDYENLREAEKLTQVAGNQRQLSTVYRAFAHHFWGIGEHEKAVAYGERSLSQAKALNDPILQIMPNFTLSQAYHSLGEYEKAIACARWNINHLRNFPLNKPITPGGAIPEVVSRTWLVWSLVEIGGFSEAAVHAEEGIEIAEKADHLLSIFHAYWGKAFLSNQLGDLATAIKLLEKCWSLCQIGNLRYMYNLTIGFLGYFFSLSGRIKEGIDLLEQSAEKTLSVGMMFFHTITLIYLGESYLLAAQVDKSTEMARRALNACREFKTRGYEAWALRLLGEIATYPEKPDDKNGESYYHQALELAEELGMRPLIAHCYLGLGRLYRRTGRKEQAKEHLTMASSMYREMGMGFWLEKAEGEMKEFY